MLATLVIVFREVIEAGLIVGIVLAATKGVPRRGLWVAYGVIGGVAGACLVAAFAGQIASLFEGSGQELFDASILTLAVGMLTWHNVWMASHGPPWRRRCAGSALPSRPAANQPFPSISYCSAATAQVDEMSKRLDEAGWLSPISPHHPPQDARAPETEASNRIAIETVGLLRGSG